MMIRILIMLCCVLSFSSVSFAGEQHTVDTSARVKSFSASDMSFVNTYVCDSADAGCTPEKLIINNPVLHFVFWSPRAQVYYRHYLITDEGGTAKYYNVFNSALAAGVNHTFNLVPEVVIPNGEYTFTAVVAGSDEGIIVSDQYRFSVR